MEFKKKVDQTNWVDTRKCKCLIFKWILPNQKLESFENWVSRNKVRVPDHSSYDRFEVLKLTRFESGFRICKNFWDISTNAKDTGFFFQPKKEEEKQKMVFQVSWFRCHIVRIQGKKERRNLVSTKLSIRHFDIFSKQTNKFENLSDSSPILPTFCHGTKVKPWKFEKKIPNLSFDWQEGRKKKGLFCKEIAKKWRNLKIWVISSQILPTFCHGNKVKPWKFEKKITKMIVRLTFERGRKEEKKLNKQTNKGNFKK